MRLTRFTDYSLRVLIYLGLQQDELIPAAGRFNSVEDAVASGAIPQPLAELIGYLTSRSAANNGVQVVVDASVNAALEVPEIHRRVIAAGGPALLFTNVSGADFPLATNLFGLIWSVAQASTTARSAGPRAAW